MQALNIYKTFIMRALIAIIYLLLISIVVEAQAPHSVLAKGRWVKVKTEGTGIKMLTQSALAQMGFADINKVAVYGNGGTAVPLLNSATRVDDLAKLPVVRTSNAILFFAQGSTSWKYNVRDNIYDFVDNEYDNVSYYYITDSTTPSGEPEVADEPDKKALVTYKTYDVRDHHALHSYNYLSSGKEFVGEQLKPASNTLSLTFPLAQRLAANTEVNISVNMTARTRSAIPYTIKFNGQPVKQKGEEVASFNIDGFTFTSTGVYANKKRTVVTSASDNTNEYKVDISATINGNSDTQVFLDYVAITSISALNMRGNNELLFRNRESYNIDGVVDYVVEGVKNSTVVWNIDNAARPFAIKTTIDGTTLHAKYKSDKDVKEYIAFNKDGQYPEPTFVEEVQNQDLHAAEAVDYLIVYYPLFEEQAKRLAALHTEHSNLKCSAVDVTKIYNEYSSGKREPAAIRDFVRSIYNKGNENGPTLKYLLLFGIGNYDNLKYGSANAHNLIPTYQSDESFVRINTYCTDDFYGWMDNNEGGMSSETRNKVDIAVGRFSIVNEDEAKVAVDKVESYLTSLDKGKWRQHVTITCDDGDENEHLRNIESLANILEEKHSEINVTKIYLEAYPQNVTPHWIEYPLATKELLNAFNEGSISVIYSGHSGVWDWTENCLLRVVAMTQNDWKNYNHMPFVISATCHTGEFDRGQSNSICNFLTFSPKGGAICSLGATRVTYSNYNTKLANACWERLLETDTITNKRYSIGDAVKYAKQKVTGNINSLKYVLIGDPAIVLPYDKAYKVSTDKINGVAFEEYDEPLKVWATHRIEGSIRDDDGNVQKDFNGQMYITIYNKKDSISTAGLISSVYTFESYNSIIYNGLVSVENGQFELMLQLPKDINVEEGYGRISYYGLSNDNKEARDYTNMLLLGGIDESTANDTIGPNINAWVEFPDFENGQKIYNTPIFYATLEDVSGINTSGVGIGHDITIVLNNDRENPIVLNKYFTYDVNSSTSGSIEYTLPTLENGEYTLTIKAWDHANNSTEKSLSFIIDTKDEEEANVIQFRKAYLYPMPLHSGQNDLKLVFAHNESSSQMTIHVSLHSFSGQRLATTDIISEGEHGKTEEFNISHELPIINTLGRGVYFVKIDFEDENGKNGSIKEKILIE